MTSEELIAKIEELIKSGGRRTTAENVRELSELFVRSFLNLDDFFTSNESQYVAGNGTLQDLPESPTTVGDHYFYGSEAADDSVRLHYDVVTKQLLAQIRVSGTWENGDVVCEFP